MDGVALYFLIIHLLKLRQQIVSRFLLFIYFFVISFFILLITPVYHPKTTILIFRIQPTMAANISIAEQTFGSKNLRFFSIIGMMDATYMKTLIMNSSFVAHVCV